MPITADTLGPLRETHRRGGDVVFSFDSSDLILTPLLPNIVRHTWVPTHWRLYTQPASAGYAVVDRNWAPTPSEVSEEAGLVRVRTGALTVEAARDPFRLRYLTASGQVLLEEPEEGGLSWSYWEYMLRYRLDERDHFYGLGQPDQLGARVELDHRGTRHEIWNRHSPPAATVLPALLSARGYGLLIDNPWRAQWDLGRADPRSFSYQARGGPLRYYVFYAPNLKDLLRTYCELTGYPPLPPRWIFGLLQSRYGYRNREELESIARTFRDKRIPCDALVLDLYWFAQMGDLSFDSAAWPHPVDMISGLKVQGFRTMVIEEPYLTEASRNYPQALAGGYLARHYDGSPYSFDFWPGRSALLDFTNPAAQAWWTEQHRPLFEAGIEGWWADLNEPSKHPQDLAHHGGSAEAVHNLYPLLMQQAIFAAQQRYAPNRRIFILSRSAYAGSQRYGAGWWSGDVDRTFAALRKQVAVGLSAGMAGIPLWGTDVGGYGFAGQCTPELYARWFQFGAFSPLLRPHGDQGQTREPWQFGPAVEEICRKYLRLRYRLLPYIYTLAHEASMTGAPLMRPLVMEFPDDPHCVDLNDQYLLGPDILVAPVLDQGAVSRMVYLPPAAWFDFWTGARVDGPCTIAVSAPLETLPLFIRAGAIVPMGPDLQFSAQRPLDPLTLEIFPLPAPGSARIFTLYEDDGETTDYQSGAYAQTRFETSSGEVLTCRIAARQGALRLSSPRTLLLDFHQHHQPGEVRCEDVPIALASDLASLRRMPAGAYWHQERKLMIVKLADQGAARIVTVA